ncbi:SDR family oxidoreductase [Lacibacter sp. H375]|uniref:SDR family oxidoreductase n=1 Tax=Lacibacter sp. H375 TaxID=3133424 RepID=UPI0030C5DCDB
MQNVNKKASIRPPQKQRKPGSERKLVPLPVFDYPEKEGSEKLDGKIALITGGDSGIGKAVAILFAKERARLSLSYLREHADAKETEHVITETYERDCLLIPGDISKERHCKKVVAKTIKKYGRIDILVNNAAIQFEEKDLTKLPSDQLLKTFETNIISMFWLTKFALPYMKKGSVIINTASVTAYRGSGSLLDYSATKGAIVAFTRSLSANLSKKGIRVNGVAPGPVWTPLIASGFSRTKVASHGSDVPLGRSAEPAEIAPSYLFLASDDAIYMTGQFLHPNGGEIING